MAAVEWLDYKERYDMIMQSVVSKPANLTLINIPLPIISLKAASASSKRITVLCSDVEEYHPKS